jgi:hypothetical protein
MESASKNAETVTSHSEDSVLHVTDHARLVPTTHSSVLRVLTTSSVQTDDVSHLALLDSISMVFQELADHAHQLVPLAALNSSVPLVQIT